MSGHLLKGADTGDKLSQRKLFPKVNFPLCCLLMLKLGFFQFGLLPSQPLQLLYFQGLFRCSYKMHKDKHKAHKCSSS